jgi:hypothetical protein
VDFGVIPRASVGPAPLTNANAYRSSSWSIAAASDVAAAANPSDRTSDGISTIQTRRAHTSAENTQA